VYVVGGGYMIIESKSIILRNLEDDDVEDLV
jgi:hypothetical protein